MVGVDFVYSLCIFLVVSIVLTLPGEVTIAVVFILVIFFVLSPCHNI